MHFGSRTPNYKTMREQRRNHREGDVERAPSLRLFYALWPDEPTRGRLEALQSGIVGRKVDSANLHLTLAFLGNQPRESLMLLESVMQSLIVHPFTLTIDSYGYFSKPRVVWVGPSSPPEALISLQRTLWQSLLDNGIPLKPSADFRPHVTLARGVRCASLPRLGSPLDWSVREFVLLESIPQAMHPRYEVRAVFPLYPDN